MLGQYNPAKYKHFTVEDDLISNTCYNITQDQDGFIWIATEGGLCKFDGKSFNHYGIDKGLKGVEVVNVICDNHNRLWLNTVGNLTYIKDDKVHQILGGDDPNLNWNFDVLNEKGKLWISYKSTFVCLDEKTLEKIPITEERFKTKKKKRIVGFHNDTLWVSIEREVFKIHEEEVIENFNVQSLHESFNGIYSITLLAYPHLYFSNGKELIEFNLITKKEKSILNNPAYLYRIRKRKGMLWVLNSDELFSLKFGADNSVEKNVIIKDKVLSDFFFDEDENLWISTNKNGIFLFPKVEESITHCSLPNTNNHLESIIYSDDKILIGTNDSKLVLIESDTSLIEVKSDKKFGVDRILDIIPIGVDHYILSADSGIHEFKNGKQRHLINSATKKLSLKEDTLYIGHYSKSMRVSLKDLLAFKKPMLSQSLVEPESPIKLIYKDRVNSVLRATNGDLWVGNVKKGLFKITSSDTTKFKALSDIFYSTITRIIELDNNVICAATNGEGIILIKDKKFFQIKEGDGLISNKINNISSDKNAIICATNRGVSMIQNFDFERRQFAITSFDKETGISSSEVLDCKKVKDTLFLATNLGFDKLDLSNVRRKKKPGKVFIEEVQVNNEIRSIETLSELNYFENNLLFKYTTPEYLSFNNKSFKYKLEGVDDDWINTNSNQIHYSQLKAGNYKLHITLQEDVENLNVSYQEFKIKSRFIDSVLFRLLLMAIGLFLILIFIDYRANQLKNRELSNLVKQRTEDLNDKVDELAIANKKLSKTNEELEQFTYIASHDLQEPLNTIHGFNELLKNDIKKGDNSKADFYLDVINDSSIRMKRLVTEILTYSKIGKKKALKKIDLNLIIKGIKEDLYDIINRKNAEIIFGDLPKINAHEVELRLLFQNLISNGIKFQKQNQKPVVTINYEELESHHKFSVKDNGIGIKDDNKEKIFEIFQRLHTKEKYKGTGIGLSHCKKIVDLHDGEIWVESKLEEGSEFYFTIAKDL